MGMQRIKALTEKQVSEMIELKKNRQITYRNS